MTELLQQLLIFIIGIFALYYGAEYLVRGGANIARILKMNPMVIGLTIVAFGTSMPEFLVGISASMKGQNDIAIGNVVGSNIANIALILGLSALVSPLIIHYRNVKKELIFLLLTSLLFVIFLIGGVSFAEGLILLAIIFAYTIFLIRHPGAHPLPEDLPDVDTSVLKNIFFIVIGLAGLILGSDFLVESAVYIARAMGVPEMVIGMSIVAVGTSLPELAASVVASLRKQMDLSIGNVIGSNIFNMLFVIGGISLVRPLPVDTKIFHLEIPVMLAYVLVLFPLILLSGGIRRRHGILLLGSYILFNLYLYYAS